MVECVGDVKQVHSDCDAVRLIEVCGCRHPAVAVVSAGTASPRDCGDHSVGIDPTDAGVVRIGVAWHITTDGKRLGETVFAPGSAGRSITLALPEAKAPPLARVAGGQSTRRPLARATGGAGEKPLEGHAGRS